MRDNEKERGGLRVSERERKRERGSRVSERAAIEIERKRENWKD